MPEPTDPKPTTDPQELKAFLASESKPGQVNFEVPPEVRSEILPETGAEEPEPQRMEIPRDTLFEPTTPQVSNVLFWTMQLPDIGKITVDDFEKVLYQKAMMNDERLILHIELPIAGQPFDVEIQSLTVFEKNAIFQHLDDMATTKESTDPAATVTRAQLLATSMMVRSINGKEFPRLDLKPANDSTKEAGKLAYVHTKLHVETMSAIHHNAILTALRIFMVKEKLCNDNVNNDSFWIPAS